jgi:translation initiation factor 1
MRAGACAGQIIAARSGTPHEIDGRERAVRDPVHWARMRNSRRVYSTEGGRVKPPPVAPSSGPAPSPVPNDGVVRIFRDRGGRNGKVVTVIRGLRPRELDERAAELKRLCGAGGAVKDGAVEIQGDHRERVAERLRALGHAVKLAGG